MRSQAEVDLVLELHAAGLNNFFSNRSQDIQAIFCDACDRLGVRWRQDGPWNISVARSESVQILDRHIGPKR